MVLLKSWTPTVYVGSVVSVSTTFAHAEVLDIRARARTLTHLQKWKDEGAVVERWVENCLANRDGRNSSLLAVGRYLKRHWSEELERQEALKKTKPSFFYSRQLPGPELRSECRIQCNEGPIGFALNVISQWHRELRDTIHFLQEMKATANFPSREGMRDCEGALKPNE